MGRIIFQNSSVVSFFCLKTGKYSKKYFRRSLTFCDQKNNEIIRFDNSTLKISKRKHDTLLWIVEGKDPDKDFRIMLETCAEKRFTMKGGGSQVYIKYAVLHKELRLKTKDRIVALDGLGGGVGTFEDAYW